MKYFPFNLTLSFALLLFFSCEKEVKLDFNHQPALCLNCILSPDSLVNARLTISRNIANNYEFDFIDDATIILFEEDQWTDTLTSAGAGKYRLNIKPKLNTRYRIVVMHDNYKDLSATTIIPSYPHIIYNPDTIEYSEQGEFYIINAFFDIHDEKDIVNYYWMDAFKTNAPFIDDFSRSIDTDSEYGFVYNYFMRIEDVGYDGEILSLKAAKTATGVKRPFWAADTHYDKYLKSSLKARINNEGELPFREPVQIYTNIENGYGIFGSCAVTTITQ